MKKAVKFVKLITMLPIAFLCLGLQAIISPSKARQILKDAIVTANANSEKKLFVEYASK